MGVCLSLDLPLPDPSALNGKGEANEGGAPGRVARMVLREMWDDLQAALHDRCVDFTILVYLGYVCVCVCARARTLRVDFLCTGREKDRCQ